ncbi:redoxin domain-containing protein [Pedobacter sp. UC225_65]|uniref:redoxin domain-containing protein n=1 Tax=Pedobacter sp. UC225_65 TaxID=3350173 RepID=UPI003670F49A
MKNYIYLVLISLTSFNCSGQETKKGYVIKGDIANLPAKSVYLVMMKRDAKNQPVWPVVDSAKVINNKFTLNKDTVLEIPGWATGLFYIDTISKKRVTISFLDNNPSPERKNQLYGNLILENTNISIKGDLKEQKGVRISGSKETDFQMKYGLLAGPPTQKINRLIDSLKSVNNITQLTLAKEKQNNIIKAYKSNFKKIIAENPATWLALLNLYQSAAHFTTEELQEFVGIFDKQLMQSSTGKKLTNYITQSKLLLVSKPFIDFNYADVNDKKFTLNSVKGKNGTLIVFWASWCGPCREEIPELKEYYKTYADKGIAIVSISADHDINSWKKALKEEKMPWPNLNSLPGNFKEITAKYNVSAIPAMFLLDKENKIVLADPDNFALVKQKTKDLLK